MFSRRILLAAIAAAPLIPALSFARPLTRVLPSTREVFPTIGLGTWQAFDIAATAPENAEAAAAVQALLDGGGRVIDASPMYRQAEAALGRAAQAHGKKLYLASKIYTPGAEAGRAQFAHTLRMLKRDQVDLMQVHNLIDTAAHLKTLRAERERGRVRHIGITHYTASAHAELCRWLKREPLDMVQVNYSLLEPEAANTVLPLAAERGVGVLINRPFAEGALFARVRGKPVPAWAREELACASWAQCFLKWILAEPAVTTVLCGTRNARHVADNLRAMHGPLPTAAQRQRLVREVMG